MKLALALTFVASVAAGNTASPMTRNCVIPPAYTFAAGNACGGVNAGYLVYGTCLNGLPRVQYAVTPAQEVKTQLTATNLMAFTSDQTRSTRAGCVVPNSNWNWDAAGMPATRTTAAGLNPTLCVNFPTATTGTPAFRTAGAPSTATVKGVAIECDRVNGFWPARGYEGTNLCINWDGTDDGAMPVNSPTLAGLWPDAPAALGGDFFASNAFFEALPTNSTIANHESLLGYAEFTSTTNSLRCAKGCTLPAEICSNGVLTANVIGAGERTGCVIPPVQVGTPNANVFSFQCLTGLGKGTVFTGQCNVANIDVVPVPAAGLAGVFAFTNGYVAQCGLAYGAQTVPLWNLDGALNGWASPIQQAAGEITNFPAVTSTLRQAYTIANSAYFTGWVRRHWNNNGAQNLMNGAVYEIIVLGCDVQPTTTARTQCTQQTLNWWRCHYNFPFYGGTICYSEFVQIACPTHELGFRCPSSSKKGLLGLLGLLGLIPLFLLCCCLLFLCCIRRRKTEADVHFATFDPHAAPVIATAPCATATACPTAFGATPFATHPSAIPCL